MSNRPYVSFDEVKQKVPIPDVLRVLGIAERFTETNGSFTGVCPLPGHQHGPSPNPQQFKINQKDGLWLWHCFGDCQRGGDVIEFVKALTGLDSSHVRFWFAEHFGERLTLRRPKPSSEETAESSGVETKKEVPPATPGKVVSQEETSITNDSTIPRSPAPLKPLRFFLNLDPDAPYLAERGLTPETIRRFGLGLCQRGILAGYVAIPVYAHPRQPDDNPAGYLGRWPGEPESEQGQQRYKFPQGFPRNLVVYGLSEALEDSKGLPLIVVEGPFKVFHLYQAGFPNAVATFGASMSDEQAEILISTRRPLILVFDGDEAGRAG
ncbi:MAG: toprim domain-containing protein, partial [Planctomycetaceae bacterium]|nr:toprim domain-containing protein [Planctomycetaceae bacterium]